jgi:hypothetical protein
MDDKLTEWEKEYLEKHLPGRVTSDIYYDNPGTAIDDVEFLLEIIKKLRA